MMLYINPIIVAIVNVGVCFTMGFASVLFATHRQQARARYESEYQLALLQRLQELPLKVHVCSTPEEAVYIPQHGQVVLDCYTTTIQLDVPSHHEPFPPITNPLNLIDFSAQEKLGSNVPALQLEGTFDPCEAE